MEYFRTDVKVGGFILVALALLVFAAITVGDVGSWLASKQRYTVLFRDASLLPEGAQVSYAGYPVGQVTAIAVRSAETRAQQHPEYPLALTITVRSTLPLRQDSRVEMKTNGMIGDRYIDIIPGMGQPLPPGSTILGSVGGFEGMLAALGSVQGGVEETITALHALLTDTSRPDSIPGTLASLQRLLDDLRPNLTALTTTATDLLQHVQQEVGSTSGKAGRALESLNATITENRPGLQRLVGEFHTVLVDMRQTMETTRALLDTSKGDVARLMQGVDALLANLQQDRREMVARIQQLLTGINQTVAQNDRNIYTTLENLRDTAANLEAASALLRANPAVLLWGTRDKRRPGPEATSAQRVRVLQDRGRVGRYDRTP